jgi:hypothetical protein
MAYRDAIEALRRRHADLEAELAALRLEQLRLADCTARADEVQGELSGLAERLAASKAARKAQRKRVSLESVRIAHPRTEKWQDMIGDDRMRRCQRCSLDVYDVSAMPRREAEALIADSHHAGRDRRRCLRLFRRADGTVMTADCPVGQRRKQATRVAAAALALGGTAAALVPAVEPTVATSLHLTGPRVPPVVVERPLEHPPPPEYPSRPRVRMPPPGEYVMGF